MAGLLRRGLDRCAAAQHDQVGQRDLLAARLRAVEVFLHRFELRQHLSQLCRLVDFPVFLRRQADASAVGPTALVGTAEGGRGGPGRGDQLGDRQAGCQ
ncbi:hypothetical protein FQZ97_973740 [compost metagenome]